MSISVKYIATELHWSFSLGEQNSVVQDPVKGGSKNQGCFFKAVSRLCSRKNCLWEYLFCLPAVWTDSNSKENSQLAVFPVCRIGLVLVNRVMFVTRWENKRRMEEEKGWEGEGEAGETNGEMAAVTSHYGDEENCRREEGLGKKKKS